MRALSWMLSALAVIRVTSEEIFDPAWLPLSVGAPTCSPANFRSPACEARAISGTKPATDTRLGPSNVVDDTGRVCESRIYEMSFLSCRDRP
jgi:hypothetical protein